MQTVFVITVCWNAVNLIEETIKSVLSQTYQDVKYLIIDGGSTDGTVDIIKKYEDQLTYWVSEPDKGIYDAMNKGLAKCRELAEDPINHEPSTMNHQSWVNFMNAGDLFADNNVLQSIFASIDIPENIKVIGGNTINVFPDGHEDVHHAEPSKVIPKRLPFSHQACIARLNPEWCFNTRYKYSADYEFLYKIFWKYGADSIQSIDTAIARYRQEDSLSMVNANKVRGEYLSIQAAHRTWQWWKEYLKWRLF